jgi:WD40 repeat protein
MNSVNDHSKAINDMQMGKDGTMFITASKDNTAKLFDTDSLMCLKTYKTERPVNSAAISPILDHVSQFCIIMWLQVYPVKFVTLDLSSSNFLSAKHS